MPSEPILVGAGITLIVIALLNPKKPPEISGIKFPDLPIGPWYMRLLIGLLGFGFLFLSGYSSEEIKILFHLPQPEKSMQKQTIYEISPSLSWQDTSIVLKAGQEFGIIASGTVTEASEKIGPQGSAIVESALDAPRPGVAHLVLVGKISDTGTVFVVGSKYEGFAEADGNLFLAVNESPTSLNDNDGSFTVTVEH